LPVKASRASAGNAFHRLENLQAHHPQAMHEENGLRSSRTRTGSPSVHPCPASNGAADFFLASALRHRQALRPAGEEDARCVRSISATHTTACTRTSCVPGSVAACAAWAPRGVLGSARHDRGNRTFHIVRDRFGGSPRARFPVESASRPLSRAWAFSSHGADGDRASDTPVALSQPLTPPPPSRGLHHRRAVGFWPWYTGRRVRVERRDHP
jgi:hypothetical protein